MEKRVIILPLDGYPSGATLLDSFDNLLESSNLIDMVAFIKINDGAHNVDLGGPTLIKIISSKLLERKLPIGIFLDLKIYDVSSTLVNTLQKYLVSPLEILTVSSQCSVAGIIKLRKLLPQTKLAMVSLLTDIDECECWARFGKAPDKKIFDDLCSISKIYKQKIGDSGNLPPEPFDMIVCSPREVAYLKQKLSNYEFIVPGIRDKWMLKADEIQKRITGVSEALDNGATFVVMFTQIVKGNPEQGVSPEQSQALTLEEIKKRKA